MSKLNICFIGDIMLGRYNKNSNYMDITFDGSDSVDSGISSFHSELEYIRNHDFNRESMRRIYGDTLVVIQKSDLLVGNLEMCVTDSDDIYEKPSNIKFNFKLDEKYSKVLKIHKPMFLCIANNHILDYKVDGLNDTLDALNRVGIKYSGAGRNLNEAKEYAKFNIKGVTIGILGCADHFDFWKAGVDTPGVYYIEYDNYGSVLQYIRNVKNEVDILILSIHWGYNFVHGVRNKFQKFAKDVFEAGVDIIHGHSSHHIKCIRYSRDENKMIIYGMGDFVSDYAINSEFRNDLGMIVMLNIENKKLVDVTIHPTKIQDHEVNLMSYGSDRTFICDAVTNDCNIQPIDDTYLTGSC